MTAQQPVQDLRAGALDKTRVVDLSRFIAGPLCSQILGDMGADVIKVERPSGEDARDYSPRYRGHSIYSMIYNRNKRAITLDTRHPSALAILERLVTWADVIVENYRPGTLEKMGIGWERIHELNPRVVLTSISGFGQSGPNKDRALLDAIAQANSGLMSLTGAPDGPPMMAGTFIADYTSAFHAVMGTLLALLARDRTGEGQHVDIACVDAMFACLTTHPSSYAMLGLIPKRTGNRDQITVPADVFTAADGHVYLHGGTDPLFRRLTAAIGQPELAQDPRFLTIDDRLENSDEVTDIVADWTKTRTCGEIVDTMRNAGIPAAKVESVPDMVESDQVREREMMVDVEHPDLGPLKLPGIPIKLSATPGTIRLPPPLIGADDDTVYEEVLGINEDALEQLRAAGVVAPKPLAHLDTSRDGQ